MIILDANALIYSVKQRIALKRFITEDIAVPSSVLVELKRLANDNNHAKIALETVRGYRILEVDKRADEGVVEAALRYHGKVMTNDSQLRKILKEKGIDSLTISEGCVRR